MSQPSPNPPAVDRFCAILTQLGLFVAAMNGGSRLPYPLICLIVQRLIDVRQCIERAAARLAAGTYSPRKSPTTPPKRTPGVKPRPERKLPRHFGWLLKLVPDAVGPRAWLELLFAEPEMQALMAAAPRTVGRPLRQLCRMLAIRPVPAAIALPEKPRKPRARWKWIKVPHERKPDPPDTPPLLRNMPPSAKWPGGRIRVYIDPSAATPGDIPEKTSEKT